ncbi:MAG: hypothetical protein WCD12_06130 [Candidatus Binatus sp.]|uniref:hypothetical protein n=1 Tax=Candidatus Binatus sp. TaxID=2811406 RepID=UPI003C775AD4
MRLRQIVFGLLVIAFGFLAMSSSIYLLKSNVDEANAQATCCPVASPVPTPAYTVNEFAALAFRASPGGVGDTNGAVLVVTSNATEQSSINFYYQCAPGADLGKIGKCPTDGLVVFSAPVCTMPTMSTGGISCSSVP